MIGTRGEAPGRSPTESGGGPVGLIGIGLMGTAIAERLLRAGYRVIGWDVDPERRSALTAMGGTLAEGSAGVVASCDRVLLSLPSDQVVAHVLRSADVPLHAGQFILDTSTGAPTAAAEQAARLACRGVAYLDATISGSSQQLRDNEAVFLVGAAAEPLEDCREILECLTRTLIHCGPPGSGARMKLITNLVLGLNRAALAEGLAFAEAVGVEPSIALRVLRLSMAYSRVMDVKGQKMLDADFAPQARLSQHLKDVRLMLREASEAGQSLPLSETHRRLLEQADADGWGDLDNSAVINAIRGSRP
ncbi:MAG: NAD(P)-dependent oxidoreductase [Isosphaeraceae bacterium]